MRGATVTAQGQSAGEVAGDVAGGAATGATLGSVMPGVGNVIGGLIGLFAGIGKAIGGAFRDTFHPQAPEAAAWLLLYQIAPGMIYAGENAIHVNTKDAPERAARLVRFLRLVAGAVKPTGPIRHNPSDGKQFGDSEYDPYIDGPHPDPLEPLTDPRVTARVLQQATRHVGHPNAGFVILGRGLPGQDLTSPEIPSEIKTPEEARLVLRELRGRVFAASGVPEQGSFKDNAAGLREAVKRVRRLAGEHGEDRYLERLFGGSVAVSRGEQPPERAEHGGDPPLKGAQRRAESARIGRSVEAIFGGNFDPMTAAHDPALQGPHAGGGAAAPSSGRASSSSPSLRASATSPAGKAPAALFSPAARRPAAPAASSASSASSAIAAPQRHGAPPVGAPPPPPPAGPAYGPWFARWGTVWVRDGWADRWSRGERWGWGWGEPAPWWAGLVAVAGDAVPDELLELEELRPVDGASGPPRPARSSASSGASPSASSTPVTPAPAPMGRKSARGGDELGVHVSPWPMRLAVGGLVAAALGGGAFYVHTRRRRRRATGERERA